MSKVTVIIPVRNELYLKQTVDDLFVKAVGDIQVVVILDGYWPRPEEMPKDDPRLVLVHRERQGMRAAINSAAAIAQSDYLMKLDAHCLLAQGFDETLAADCDKDWIVIPRRYSLEPDDWTVRLHRPFVDYEYLSWPYRHDGREIHGSKYGLNGMVWDERIAARIDRQIDETMTFQGSCWFTPREYFLNRIGPMDETGYGTFIGEAQELGLKSWLGGGKTIINKKTWYAHLWKGAPYRAKYKEIYGTGYSRIGFNERKEGNLYAVDYWLNDRWEKRVHNLEWLIDRFYPVPSWPEDKNEWIPSNE
jgi:glycosyltransferase involved in cell wall biosynthesis